jgi:UDP-2,3-diacylglucosamine hydrolase
MIPSIDKLPEGKKLYFASDFHLGTPSQEQSLQREKKIVRWLDEIKDQTAALFLVGDIFDFWFEYKHSIPKGFIRFQGKIAEFTDAGIPVYFFSGNHDMWMFDYFTKELNVPIFHHPQRFSVGDHWFYVGHGDGLGPKDYTYKLLKILFRSPICQWLFARIHPNFGIGIADAWSKRSRITNSVKDDVFLGDDEWLLVYAKAMQLKQNNQFYIFGHRHLPLDVQVAEDSKYINLGEWVNNYTYAVYDGKTLNLQTFEN